MDITYRKFEEFGRTYYRIITRRHTSDYWQVAAGEFDRDDESLTKKRVRELAAKHSANILHTDMKTNN